MVVRRGAAWPGRDLSPVERRIAAELDGKRTLAELYRAIRGSYFRFLQGAYRLAINAVLDIDSVGEPIDSTPREMSLSDLLLEQATEEQILVAHRHMAVPLDLLERWVPVWVAEPAGEEQKRMPSRARDFYARLDGKTSLGDAFSGDARLRGRAVALLLLQLQKGRPALLPAPVSQLEAEAEHRAQPPLERWWQRVFAKTVPR